MSDPEDLARRYLALWEEYFAAALSGREPLAALRQWLKLLNDAGADDNGEDAPSQREEAGSSPGTSAVSGAPRGGVPSVAELARRLALLEERLAALEARWEEPRGAPRRDRRLRHPAGGGPGARDRR